MEASRYVAGARHIKTVQHPSTELQPCAYRLSCLLQVGRLAIFLKYIDKSADPQQLVYYVGVETPPDDVATPWRVFRYLAARHCVRGSETGIACTGSAQHSSASPS